MANKMKKTVLSCLIIICLLCSTLAAGCSLDDVTAEQEPIQLEDIVNERDNLYSCVFDGVKHNFILYLPETPQGAPLIVMLHGYGESAAAFRGAVQIEDQANPLGYAVVYVSGAPDPTDSTSAPGWNSGISANGGGNKDVEFLSALAEHLTAEFSLDKSRVYAVGFSNGAFMTHRLAMDAGDVFSAVVSVAGKMPASVWERRREKNDVGFFQITGEKDDVVPKKRDGSVKYSKDPAIEDVMEYWASSDGLTISDTIEVGHDSTLTKYTDEDGGKQVWHLCVKGGRHSWPSEQFAGFDANKLILEFLETQKAPQE